MDAATRVGRRQAKTSELAAGHQKRADLKATQRGLVGQPVRVSQRSGMSLDRPLGSSGQAASAAALMRSGLLGISVQAKEGADAPDRLGTSG